MTVPLPTEMLVVAFIMPANALSAPIVAELPTAQVTLSLVTPPESVTTALAAVVSVEPI